MQIPAQGVSEVKAVYDGAGISEQSCVLASSICYEVGRCLLPGYTFLSSVPPSGYRIKLKKKLELTLLDLQILRCHKLARAPCAAVLPLKASVPARPRYLAESQKSHIYVPIR